MSDDKNIPRSTTNGRKCCFGRHDGAHGLSVSEQVNDHLQHLELAHLLATCVRTDKSTLCTILQEHQKRGDKRHGLLTYFVYWLGSLEITREGVMFWNTFYLVDLWSPRERETSYCLTSFRHTVHHGIPSGSQCIPSTPGFILCRGHSKQSTCNTKSCPSSGDRGMHTAWYTSCNKLIISFPAMW